MRRVAGEVALAALRRLEVGGEDEERARRLRLLALRRLERRDPVAARADQFAEAVERRLVVDAEDVVDDDDGGAVAQQRLRDALAPGSTARSVVAAENLCWFTPHCDGNERRARKLRTSYACAAVQSSPYVIDG